MDTTAVQTALSRLGYAPGPIDGAWGAKTKGAVVSFQAAKGLTADGVLGPKTIAALQAAVAEMRPVAKAPTQAVEAPAKVQVGGIVPADWMPAARIERIIFHWTAGSHRASGLDRSHYHILIEVDGKLVCGTPSIAANGIGGTGPRASHTLSCNTGSIGVSLCCMAGAVESPFRAGSAPMSAVQWKTLADVLADLCRRYGVPVTPKTVLSHAEVQSNLGIRQRGKWDVARLAFDPSIVGAKACGDAMRAMVGARL
ncbi:MAG: peptidoglycan-binding protein [Beijerinckiaceae bacterium]|nr:peptidoglycan-binding protein [Beijerinckiaceae bacterium]